MRGVRVEDHDVMTGPGQLCRDHAADGPRAYNENALGRHVDRFPTPTRATASQLVRWVATTRNGWTISTERVSPGRS